MNLYIKIFATFILPLSLGLIFTILSLNSVLLNQEKLIMQRDDIEQTQIENRFKLILQSIQRDINILTKSYDIVDALEIHDNNVLTNWGQSFLGNQYSTVIFMNDKNTIISRASDQYRFGDTLDKSIIEKINSKDVYQSIFIIDNKELLVYSKKIRNYTNKVVGSVLLGITIDKKFLKNVGNTKKVALKYTTSRGNAIYSQKLEDFEQETLLLTYIKEIDSLKRFYIQKGFNTEIKDLKNFKLNILTFAVVTCVVIIFLLYFILTNFLRPYKRIYTLLLDFAENKIDFKHIRNVSRNIANQTNTKEIYHMAKAISKVSKKALKNEEELRKISFTDQLTKILNRRKLDEILLKESYAANRYKKELSIVLIDIDYFKTVNDTHGHLIGDKILKQFSTVITENLRPTDYFGRWGGEEFLIISTNTNIEGAYALTTKIRNIIKEESFVEDITLTASFGIGEILQNENVYNLISRTDEALYKAKNEGRDKIEKAT